ncbi:transcriptional repressor NrdR [Candidatus Poribacteria bacterium]|mgnify:FL=1|jgi:transcriptional repressor NrdR|nr:transcriptional repressor NrdR [Candidatus Poribacteria bacterium]MBT5533621.1 transcriptional repressor NrdR [Candidatus Poribacteria bacterium]MBT7097385.1 transcriptional repressor NrdR [Candidatus Poribacteria bacterium]MBT7806401.1 transcriptional repressor NrdR [Candidatus Poribacteria bacterium]
MLCPYCRSRQTRVVDKRDAQDGAVIRRRRKCLDCDQRFTTYEQSAILDMAVIKKDGTRQNFDRQKLRQKLQVACAKRPVGPEALDALVAGVEQRLISRPTKEVASHAIGEMVMDALKDLDQVAYIRFASVYRDFHDAEDFEEALKQLQGS